MLLRSHYFPPFPFQISLFPFSPQLAQHNPQNTPNSHSCGQGQHRVAPLDGVDLRPLGRHLDRQAPSASQAIDANSDPFGHADLSLPDPLPRIVELLVRLVGTVGVADLTLRRRIILVSG